jgi:glutamine amidotransferase
MSAPRIAVVDYQAGNLRSVEKALQRFGADVVVTSDSGELAGADALVFPGQGANDSSMRHLRARGLVEPIREFVRGGKPFLGVCLGLQLLFEGSDEGVEPGLGLLSGWVRRLPGGVKVPHMGWNRVDLRADHPVFDGVASGSYFYFVHSYYADPQDESVVLGTTSYGLDFCSAAAWDNVVAVQFHPEKSGDLGLRIYRQFIDLVEAQPRIGVGA